MSCSCRSRCVKHHVIPRLSSVFAALPGEQREVHMFASGNAGRSYSSPTSSSKKLDRIKTSLQRTHVPTHSAILFLHDIDQAAIGVVHRARKMKGHLSSRRPCRRCPCRTLAASGARMAGASRMTASTWCVMSPCCSLTLCHLCYQGSKPPQSRWHNPAFPHLDDAVKKSLDGFAS